ncbi:MAG: hypothetical protein MIO92_13000 [Methanosarcinaceae archaeon]|nr:hypothetical protein [Methanosarcinaceae archaeon]
MSVLNNLLGKRSEDLSTEILAYLLSSKKRYVPFQRLFYNLIGIGPLSAAELEVQAKTQQRLGDKGIPDLIILTADSIILLENKLGAYLSGDNQLLLYSEAFNMEKKLAEAFYLKNLLHVHKKILVFLAPSKSMEISRIVTDKACEQKYKTKYEDFLISRNVIFRSISWEMVIGLLDRMDSLQDELFLYVQDFLNIELTKEEKMILQNPDIPAGILKLFNYVENIASELPSMEWKIGRITQSYYYYGFNLDSKRFKCYFGYMLPLWEDFKTPIFLMVRDEWIKGEIESAKALLIENDFVPGKDHGLVRPFKIDSIAVWKKDLIDILGKIGA